MLGKSKIMIFLMCAGIIDATGAVREGAGFRVQVTGDGGEQ